MTEQKFPAYLKIRSWCQLYGRSDVPDQRGVGDFMECETTEVVKGLQAELIAVADGKYDEQVFDNLVGIRRRVKHGTYQEWAKIMLQWIAGYRG